MDEPPIIPETVENENEAVEAEIVANNKIKAPFHWWPLFYSISNICFLIAYLIIGCLWWHEGIAVGWAACWGLLLVPEIVASIVKSVIYKDASRFNIGFVVVISYVCVGIAFHLYGIYLWHPYWIEWLAIPLYYFIAAAIDGFRVFAFVHKRMK